MHNELVAPIHILMEIVLMVSLHDTG